VTGLGQTERDGFQYAGAYLALSRGDADCVRNHKCCHLFLNGDNVGKCDDDLSEVMLVPIDACHSTRTYIGDPTENIGVE
jgi:hypothetical protein